MNHKGFGKISKAFIKAVPEKTRAGHERIYMDEKTLMPAPSAPVKKPQTAVLRKNSK